MFDLQKCGTLMTVGINLAICGAVVYYIHKRMRSLENAMLKQNQVFSSFMTEIQREMNKRSLATVNSVSNELASPEAIAAVSKMVNINKIEVSDDDLSEDDDDSSNDDDLSECSDDSGDEDADVKKIKLSDFDMKDGIDHSVFSLKEDVDLANHIEDMMVSSMANNFMMMQQGRVGSGGSGIVFINGNSLMMNNDNTSYSGMPMPYIEEITDLNAEENKKVIVLNNLESDSDDDSDDEAEEGIIKIVKKSTPPRSPLFLQIESLNDKDEPIKIINSEDFEDKNTSVPSARTKVKGKKTIVTMDMESGELSSSSSSSKSVANESNKLDQLKIDDLRKLVVDKNLETKENVKKMKKPELLLLLAPK